MAKGRKKKAPIDEKSLQGFKYLRDIIPLLDRFHLVKDHHNRDLHYDQYLSFILLFYFNPVITSLRGIQEASYLKKVQKRLGVKATSLGSLSEAQGVFDAQLLAPLIPELARKAALLEKDPKLKTLQQTLTAVDGSLLPALPKMLWALWLDDKNKAAKLHLEFDILKGVPTRGEITHGNANEKTNLRNALSPNKLYVLDAGFNLYSLFQDIINANSSVVARLRDNAVWEILEERPLTKDDITAGVTKDIVGNLGGKNKQESLSSAIDAKSPWTAGHSERVTKYALQIGKEMGLSEKELKDLELAGLLHDVGKIGTYESILDKPGKLTDEERAIMRQHPAKGAEILAPIKQWKDIIPGVKYHHEFYDGTGYPEGLKGEAIPLHARILTVADTVDAMGADRPYREGRAMDVIIAELKRCSGTQFDPKVAEAFLKFV